MRKVKDLTGPGHTDQFGIGGTDLGVMAVAPDVTRAAQANHAANRERWTRP